MCKQPRAEIRAAVTHLHLVTEVNKGFSPASADSVARYLAQHANGFPFCHPYVTDCAFVSLAPDQGFEMTQPRLRWCAQLRKQMPALHPAKPQQAVPLQIGRRLHWD